MRDVATFAYSRHDSSRREGRRFLAIAGGFLSILEIAKILKARMGAAASRVPTRQLPNWLVRLASLRDPAVKLILPELGVIKNATNDKAKRRAGLGAEVERRIDRGDRGELGAARAFERQRENAREPGLTADFGVCAIFRPARKRRERFSPSRPGGATFALIRAALRSNVITPAYHGFTPLATDRSPIRGPTRVPDAIMSTPIPARGTGRVQRRATILGGLAADCRWLASWVRSRKVLELPSWARARSCPDSTFSSSSAARR